jgi:fumarate reductase flavoprotein subunit
MVIRAQNLSPQAEHVPALVVGGGGCGLAAAIALAKAGVDTLILERDSTPLGTTAMSTGLIPGAGSRLQRGAGIEDSADLFAQDIIAKNKGQCDAAFVQGLAKESGPTIDWLCDDLGLELSLVDGFLYPGHSVRRMHGMPSRSGAELIGALTRVAEESGVAIMTRSLVIDLIVNDLDVVIGVIVERPGGAREEIGCDFLLLACCGFAGNHDLVKQLIPELEHATFYGHPGNKGHALQWGQEIGAAFADLGAYQGHAGLAVGHGIPILWPLIAKGGIQVNSLGWRFANESRGYSDQTVDVLAQPGHFAWSIFDSARHELMLQFADYQDALKAGCIIEAADIDALALQTGLPIEQLAATLDEVKTLCATGAPDQFGRSFAGLDPLVAPYRAAKVTGALFHTQGGLEVTLDGQVKRAQGGVFPNLFAGGGAARGVSGRDGTGYIAGNGLLTATTLGRLAGQAIARTYLHSNQAREIHD